MARTNNLTNFLTDVADAIRTKTGSSAAISASNFDTEIESIPSGGGTVEPADNDVIFYDYDGTKLFSYTAQQFLALEAMPELPVSHSGLTPQGWNWTLANAKQYVEENGGCLDIAQIYDATVALRVFVELDDAHLKPYLGLKFNGTVSIDWGDNSTVEQVEASGSDVYTQHIYQNPGNYAISVTSENVGITIPSSSFYGSLLFVREPNLNNLVQNASYGYCVKHIQLGNLGNISNFSCYNLANLETINIPQKYINVASTLFQGCFQNCSHLKFFAFPDLSSGTEYPRGMRMIISSDAFKNCTNLIAVSLPRGVCAISTDAFQSCTSLKRVVIPNSIDTQTGLGSYATSRNIKDLIIPRVTRQKNGTISNQTLYINQNFCQYSYLLRHIFINKNVSNIYASSFTGCCSCLYVDFSEHTSVPTLANKNAFSDMHPNYKIIVPDSLYNTWKTTNVWSDSSIVDHIISKTDWDALQNA